MAAIMTDIDADRIHTDLPRDGWIDRRMPAWTRPYLKLARFDRPTGIWLLLLPCLWAIGLASPNAAGGLGLAVLFTIGAIVMRGAGCTVNDIIDRKIDAQVERTRGRPLPSGQVGLMGASIFLALELAVGFVILIQLDRLAIGLGVASLILVGLYPLMKRLTWWPQAFLGLTFNWGAIMGWAATPPPRIAFGSALALVRGGVLLDPGLRHDLRASGFPRRRAGGRQIDGAPLRPVQPAVADRFRARHAGAAGPGRPVGGSGHRLRDHADLGGAASGLAVTFVESRRPARLPQALSGQPLDRLAGPAGAGRRTADPLSVAHHRYTEFVHAETSIGFPSLVPEIALNLASEVTPLWYATEANMEKSGLPPPFWAFAWPGGQALARLLLDEPERARGRRVLDFAAGCGIAGIAAAKSGASRVVASEIDLFAAAAIRINAAGNGVSIEIVPENVLGTPPQGFDLILAGDLCYERDMAERVFAWLSAAFAAGAEVLLADPGRNYLPKAGLTELMRCDVPTLLDIENRAMMETVVYRVSAL